MFCLLGAKEDAVGRSPGFSEGETLHNEAESKDDHRLECLQPESDTSSWKDSGQDHNQDVHETNESVLHLMQVVKASPTHSGALFELAAVQQDRQNYENAINLLRRAINGKESVDEVLEKEFLGAPTPDAKATLAGALSHQSYGGDEKFALKHIGTGTGATTQTLRR